MTGPNLKAPKDPSTLEVVETLGSTQAAASVTSDDPKKVDDALRSAATDEGSEEKTTDDLPNLETDTVKAWVNEFKIPWTGDGELTSANRPHKYRGVNDYLYFEEDGKRFKIEIYDIKVNGVKLGKQVLKGGVTTGELISAMESAGYICTTFEEANDPDSFKHLIEEKSKPVNKMVISSRGRWFNLASLKEREAVLEPSRGKLGSVFFIKGGKLSELYLVNLRKNGEYLNRDELAQFLREAGFEFIEDDFEKETRWLKNYPG